MTTILLLLEELNRPIERCWVKGHQDNERSYDDLPRDARLNVDVDILATEYFKVTDKTPPRKHTDHLPSQQISLTINGKRFPANWDSNLRWSINGSYMKQYLLTKNDWSETIWGTIDFTMVRAYMNHKSSTDRTKWFKYMHNLQAVGTRKQMMTGARSDIRIDMCACCQLHSESQQHMILCESNPKRGEALAELHSGGSKYREHHRFTTIFTDCVEQWLLDPTKTPSSQSTANMVLTNHSEILQPHMVTILQEAIREQTAIGWLHVFHGYVAKKWRTLASSHMINPLATPQTSDGNRRMGTVLQRIQAFLSLIWTGRNEALHRNDHDDVRRFQSLEAAEIRHYFSQPHLLAVQDQHYCSGPILTLLRSRPAYRRRWLMRVRRARAAMLTEQHRQARMTAYFPRQPSTDNNSTIQRGSETHTYQAKDTRGYTERHTPPLSTHRRQQFHIRRPQQQPQMTHFFPGRPPDSGVRLNSQRLHKSHAST